MRPLAKAVTRSLDTVRNLLREACYRNNQPHGPIKLDSNELVTEMLFESLKIFDRLFAEFELSYVSAMVPVKTTQEYELQELIGVLFSETLQRALKMRLVKQEMVDECDPALMFTIPRLAIVSGLLIFPNGPLCIDKPVELMSELFRPFRTLLHKIRELLWTLNKRELYMLEKLLCDNEQISDVKSVSELNINSDLDDYINRFYNDYPLCKDYISNFYTVSVNNDQNDAEIVEEATETISPSPSDNIDIPSTSGYFITNTISHETMQSNLCPDSAARVESLPDHDSLEVISAAAATLSNLLSDNEATASGNNERKKTEIHDPESTDDSGICTENTSLDRSPSSDYCVVKTQEKIKKATPKKCLPRKRSRFHKKHNCDRSPEEDNSSVGSSDTSSFNSNCADDEEIAMAMQAAEFASRNEVRAKYGSAEDLIHRLFVCIAGVADQLQTNFASDLRNILKYVFLMNTSDPVTNTVAEAENAIEYHQSESQIIENNEFSVDPNILAQEALFDTNVYFHLDDGNQDDSERDEVVEEHMLATDLNNLHVEEVQDDRPPVWIPDIEAPRCMSCKANFTVVKRRHHCRNCGKVFCARCSSNSVPLPKFGHIKPVRVCNKCFIYRVTPFTM